MSHRRTQNSGDWSNYLSSQLSNLSVEIKKTVGTASTHVAEQTQGLRQDVNSKISNVSVWIDSKMNTPPPRVDKSRHQLVEEKRRLEHLLQVQSDLFERKLKSLTAHIDRLENISYNQKDEIRELRLELDKRSQVLEAMKKNVKNYKGEIEESDIVEALRKLDDESLTRMLGSIALIQQERRDSKLRNTECSICFSEKKCCAFIPCGHLCVCQDCAEIIEQKTSPTCPICREKVESHFRVYD